MMYHIFKARYVYGGPFPGEWHEIVAYNDLEDVKWFLKSLKLVRKFETRYESNPDSMGCHDLYKIEVELDV